MTGLLANTASRTASQGRGYSGMRLDVLRAVLATVIVALALLGCGAPLVSPPGSRSPTPTATALPSGLPESDVDAAQTAEWVRRASQDAATLVPPGDRLVPAFVHYDPSLSVVILQDCRSRSQVLLQYIGDDAVTARLSWSDYPSGKQAAVPQLKEACGW
jgi:hypothetical protein